MFFTKNLFVIQKIYLFNIFSEVILWLKKLVFLVVIIWKKKFIYWKIKNCFFFFLFLINKSFNLSFKWMLARNFSGFKYKRIQQFFFRKYFIFHKRFLIYFCQIIIWKKKCHLFKSKKDLSANRYFCLRIFLAIGKNKIFLI